VGWGLCIYIGVVHFQCLLILFVLMAFRSRKSRLRAVGTRCADHMTSTYSYKCELTSPTSGGRSVDVVRFQTKGQGVWFCDPGVPGSIPGPAVFSE
jgi:hypothetical protein